MFGILQTKKTLNVLMQTIDEEVGVLWRDGAEDRPMRIGGLASRDDLRSFIKGTNSYDKQSTNEMPSGNAPTHRVQRTHGP